MLAEKKRIQQKKVAANMSPLPNEECFQKKFYLSKQ
jgi:hypothetical protein